MSQFQTCLIASVSTRFITPEDASLMKPGAPGHVALMDGFPEAAEGSPGDIFVVPSEEGVFDDLAVKWKAHGFSPAFIRMMTAARVCGVVYVMIDRDGDDVDGLPEQKW